MEKIKVKDFEIKSRFTGSRIASNPNEVVYYIIYTPTGKQISDIKFYHKVEARKWISRTVKAANEIRRRQV